MKKRLFPTSLAFLTLLTGCGNGNIKIDPNKAKYSIGVCQLIEHKALDAATSGFCEALTKGLKDNGRDVEIEIQYGANEAQTCLTVINGFLAKNVDLILANATLPLQQAYNATAKNMIPILGTSITDYASALNLEFKDGKSGTNVSGTSDLISIDKQLNNMCELLPSMKQVGILYCSSESNSKFQVDEAKKFFKAHDIAATEYAFVDTTDLVSICTAANSKDAIYIPTDNTVASNVETVNAILTKPVFAAEEGICVGCGCATLTIDYHHLGELTGAMAVNVLLGKEDIRQYAVQYEQSPVAKYSKERCQKYGINVPSGYVEL